MLLSAGYTGLVTGRIHHAPQTPLFSPTTARKRLPKAVQGKVEDGKEVIPEIGWLWQVNKQPALSASSTVANLKKDRIKAKKSLGQNFVTDDAVLANIVKHAGVQPGNLVLEIGPGTGNLTKHLLQRGAFVTAVEKDDTLYSRLVDQYKQEERLRLVNGDVLRVGVQQVIEDMLQQQRSRQEGQGSDTPSSSSSDGNGSTGSRSSSSASTARRVKVVANLPYNITKDFLKFMLPLGDVVSELSIMIQEEVAQRLVYAKPGQSDYRAMNLRVHFYSKPKYRFKIDKTKYFPVPGVDGALVTFQLLPESSRPKVPSERGFMMLVHKAFSARRKMMRNNMRPMYSVAEVEAALTAVGLRSDIRAQDLTVEQFVAVHWKLHEAVLAALEQGDGADDDSDAAASSQAQQKKLQLQLLEGDMQLGDDDDDDAL